MTLLITGTGSLAKRIMHRFKDKYSKIVAFSRDEYKHSLLPEWVTSEIGDIRDYDRLDFVFKTHKPDICIHTAALKRVDMMEVYPLECVLTNVIGTENVAKACRVNDVKTSVLISTDKSVSPVNIYGCTKSIARGIYADYSTRSQNTSYLTCLYGNCAFSTGSFLPLWEDKIKKSEPIYITNENCTRFMFSLDNAVDLIDRTISFNMSGDCIVPIMDSFRITDVVKALGIIHDIEPIVVNTNKLRPGEKIHEEMIAQHEVYRTFSLDDETLCVVPSIKDVDLYTDLIPYTGPIVRSDNFINNNIEDLIALINRSRMS